LAAVLEITMIAFEDAFFGRKTLSREAFERSWQRLARTPTPCSQKRAPRRSSR